MSQRLQKQLCSALSEQLKGKRVVMPEAGRQLVRAFDALSETRTWHAQGPNAITFTEIEAWMRLTGTPLKPDHVAIIRAMDRTFKDAIYTRQVGAPEGMKTLPPVSQHPISAALLDVMMG